MKALRRLIAAITVALLAFRAIGSFLSWVEKQEDSETDAWIDEDEFEEDVSKCFKEAIIYHNAKQET